MPRGRGKHGPCVPEYIDKIMEMYCEGWKQTDIADYFGVSKQAIHALIKKHGSNYVNR